MIRLRTYRKAYANFSAMDIPVPLPSRASEVDAAWLTCEREVHQWLLAATRRRSRALPRRGVRRLRRTRCARRVRAYPTNRAPWRHPQPATPDRTVHLAG